MKLFKKADIILILILCITSISSLFTIPKLLSKPSQEKQIVINLDGTEIYRFPLEHSEETKFIEFPFIYKGNEYIGKLEIKNGRVMLHRLSEEISPLSIHTDMGWISESYQMIICLPIRLYITIEDTSSNDDFDIIVY